MLQEDIFDFWVAKEKKIVSRKKRKYPHFDPKIDFFKNIKFYKNYFNNPLNIARHSFYPFIKMELETPRYKKISNNGVNGRPIRVKDIKKRPLAYCAHFDAFIYSWFSTLLTKKYEKLIEKEKISQNVLAYIEKGASNIEFSHEVFEYIKSKGECVTLAFDITSFFDGLDHEHLKKMWCKVLDVSKLPNDHFKVFKSLTKYSYVVKKDLENEFPFLIKKRDKGDFIDLICTPKEFRSRVRGNSLIRNNCNKIKLKDSEREGELCGILQGSPLSACLSNIYMLEFDVLINKIVSDVGGLYRRYCDDIIIVVDSENGDKIKKQVQDKIRLFHLEINNSKTEVTKFIFDKVGELRGYDNNHKYRNLQYLGFEFNGQNTYIRSSSMSRYNRRMSAMIRKNLKAAYGSKSIGNKVFKKKLYERYSDVGKRNFITYAERASEYMQSSTIKKQCRNSLKKVVDRFHDKKNKFELEKKPKKIMI
ncbi:MAG: antiviral reverse transcriptase Drt2 [Marinifilaceae bacterium]